VSPEDLVGQLVRYHGSLTDFYGGCVVTDTHEGYAFGIGTRLMLADPYTPERIAMSNVRLESVSLIGASKAAA
jgi:hypothetical protein